MPQIALQLPPLNELINDRFIPLWDCKDRYVILYGGRGSSKTDFVAKRLIFKCLLEPHFLCLMVRRRYNTIKESQFETIKQIVEDLGLSRFFTFTTNPYEIRCANGNRFIARGCDDTTGVKSIKDPTDAWYEEDIIEWTDFLRITTSIRTKKAPHLQEWFTVNPEVEGDFTDNWFWKMFFGPDRHDLSFRTETPLRISTNRVVILSVTVHHSTYHDNRWIADTFVAFLENLEVADPYYYQVYTKGHWGRRKPSGQAYKDFNEGTCTAPTKYDPRKPLHISFDFNSRPYMTALVFQFQDTYVVHQIDEFCLEHPDSTTDKTALAIARRYHGHQAGMFIYGDPAGHHEDTRMEKGHNDYTVILSQLSIFRPQKLVDKVAPAVVKRIEFMNAIFRRQVANNLRIRYVIGTHCRKTIDEFTFVKEAPSREKLKEKVTDKDGFKVEKYGHISDAADYFIVKAFGADYQSFLRTGSPSSTQVGKNVAKNQY